MRQRVGLKQIGKRGFSFSSGRAVNRRIRSGWQAKHDPHRGIEPPESIIGSQTLLFRFPPLRFPPQHMQSFSYGRLAHLQLWSGWQRSDVLQKLNDEVRECYAHAKACARKAATQSDPALRQSFLDAEQSWLRLVKRLASVSELDGD